MFRPDASSADPVSSPASRPVSGAAPVPPRAEGAVSMRVVRRDAVSAIADLRHQGSAKALFPRTGVDRTGQARLEAVLINTAGGVTGGDRFSYRAAAEAGAWLRLSTQAAEKGYRAPPGPEGRIDNTLTLGPGARIDWLPQETILYDGAAISRRLEVEMAPGARLLAIEPIVIGRTAMGEAVQDLRFSDQWRVRRGGALIFADALRLSGDAGALMDRPALGAGARAMASLLYIGADAEQRLVPLRAVFERLADAPHLTATGGASIIGEDVLTARLLAKTGYALRAALVQALAVLADAPPPKVWTL